MNESAAAAGALLQLALALFTAVAVVVGCKGSKKKESAQQTTKQPTELAGKAVPQQQPQLISEPTQTVNWEQPCSVHAEATPSKTKPKPKSKPLRRSTGEPTEEELHPRELPQDDKAKKIAAGQTRSRTDYPTMDELFDSDMFGTDESERVDNANESNSKSVPKEPISKHTDVTDLNSQDIEE